MRIVFLTACIVGAGWECPARAQPLFAETESIESWVINADLVFVATIEKIHPQGHAGTAKGRNTNILVRENLKQEVLNESPYRKLQMVFPQPLANLKEWQKQRTRLLMAYDERAPNDTRVIELTQGKIAVMSADLKLLTDAKSVLGAAREALKRTPRAIKRIHTFGLSAPRKTVAATKWNDYYETGGYLSVKVPVDERLKARALKYLQSKNPLHREEGRKAMRFFRRGKR